VKVLKITPERCTGCLRCEIACSYVQVGAFQPAKSVIRVSPFEGHTSYAPYTCTQCAEGWCMTACPVGAITINAAGAKDVLDDPRARRSSAISAAAIPRAPTHARRRPSSTKRFPRAIGCTASRPSARRTCWP